jgi:2-keto-4-pentenoate hydratase
MSDAGMTGEKPMNDLASALHSARVHGGLVAVGEHVQPTNLEEAYALQSEVIALFASETIGWKLGATNVKTLELLGFEEPFFGPLLASHWYPNGSEVPIHAEHSPSLETEFLVKLARDLPGRPEAYTLDEVTAAIEYVCPAFELVGCRVEGGFGAAGLMLIPDGTANLAVVHGDPVAKWDQADLSDHPLRVEVNGVEAASGSSNLLLWGNPLGAVAWLASHPNLRDCGLRQGDYIMTGTCGGLIPVKTGDRAEADFGMLGKVALSVCDD